MFTNCYRITLFAVLSFAFSQTAFADGCFVGYKDVYAPDQKAAIVWDGSVETMILATKLQSASVADFGWLIPIRATEKPEIELGDARVFYSLSSYCQSAAEIMRAIDYKGRSVEVLEEKKLDIYDITVLKATDSKGLASWLAVNNFKFADNSENILNFYANKRFFFVAVKLDLLNKHKADIDKIGQSRLPLIESVINRVSTHHSRSSLYYDLVQNILENKPYGSNWQSNYMSREDYESLRAKYAGEPNDIEKFHENIVMLCNLVEDLKYGVAKPLKISFKTKQPTFPLRISSINAGTVNVTAYVFSRVPFADTNLILKLENCCELTAGFRERMREFLPVESSRWVSKIVFDGSSAQFTGDAFFGQTDQTVPHTKGDKTENLIRAIRDGDLVSTKQILNKYHPDLNKKVFNYSLFEFAVRTRQTAIAEYFINKGADVNSKIDFRGPVLVMATEFQDVNMVKLLLNRGADVNKSDKSGYTALHHAVRGSNTEIIELLLKHGTNIEAKTNYGETPLQHMLGGFFSKEKALLLLEKGANLNTLRNGEPLLNDAVRYASSYGGTEKCFLEFLLENGADINGKDSQGTTALEVAEQSGNQTIITLLKKYGGNQIIKAKYKD